MPQHGAANKPTPSVVLYKGYKNAANDNGSTKPPRDIKKTASDTLDAKDRPMVVHTDRLTSHKEQQKKEQMA